MNINLGGFNILTRHEIQLNLLKEVDAICSENDLHYFLVGSNALSAYNNHTINTGSRMVAVAMPSDDLEIFTQIVKKQYKKDRYIEKSTNNKDDPLFFIAYGDKNTTFFVLSNLNMHSAHGIIIRIYPIRKPVGKAEDVEQSLGIRASMKKSFNKFVKKHMINRDVFYVRYGLDIVNFFKSLAVNSYRYLIYKYPKAILKERLYNVFGRNSWFTNFLVSLYQFIYSALDATYFFFKNFKKHPFIETWDDLKYYSNAQIIKREVSTEFSDEIDKIDVDGIHLNLPGHEFFTEVFGKNYMNKTVKNKSLKATAILDTGTGYEEIIRERRKYINEIKAIQREVRKTRYEVLEDTRSVNNVINLVKMTDLQIRYQRYFDRNGEYLFSLDVDDDEQFAELFSRLSPIVNSLRRYAQYNMTFSIDEEADSLLKKILLKIGEEELIDRINELSNLEYFIE